MDKNSLRDTLPSPQQSDTRMDGFWADMRQQFNAPVAEPKRDLDTKLSDYPKAVGAGALELVGGIGELARGVISHGKENEGKTAWGNVASAITPVMKGVAATGDLAQSGADALTDGMSSDAKEAIGRSLIDETPEGRLTMGDGAGDIDVWAMKMAQGVGSMVPTLLAGGVTGVAAKASIGRAVTASMIKRGATQEVAEAVAAKAVSKIATGGAVTTGATGSVGSAGVNTRESVLGMSFDELSRSDTFRQAFTSIDQDQQTQHLSDEEKLSMAREETANVASRATMSDAKVWGAAAMGSVMGDAMLFKMLAGKAATGGVLKGAAKGAVGEGIGETLEEGVQQYTINESLNEVAAADIDPMKGVVSSALEGGLIGMGTGGALGGAGGLRGSKSQPESEGGAQADPATVEDVVPVEQSDPMQANPAAAPADPDLAPAADTMADPVVAPSGEQSPLGPSASQFDELRDVPAYLRRDDTAERFKGMAADSEVQRALAGEFGQSVQELVASQMQAGDQGKSLYERAQAGELGLDPFAGNKSAQQVAMENQRPALPLKDVIFAGDANAARGMTKEGHFDDKQAGTGPQFRGAERTRWQSGQEGDVLPPETSTTKPAGELPGAVIEGEAREVGTELPHRDVVYGADQRQPDAKPMRGSATESAVGPLQTLRITRKGKPFATEKEAAMASRKGKEMPVPLNGGGFGVAEIAEVEQVKAAATTQPSAPQLDDISVTDQNQPSDQPAASVSAETVPAPSATSGDASQLAPAIDTGYREVIPVNQPQTEVSNEPVTPVPAISSEGQGDQPGAGEPAAAGAGPAIAGLADRAGSGNPADNTPAPPVPDGQQQDDPTLTAPAPDAGAAVSEVAQPDPVVPAPVAAPTPWAEAIDNPDGTITLKGEVPLIKQWAKESGVKAMPGKGGLLVAKSSAAKVREYAAPAASEPVQQIEAARAEVAPEPTDAQKEAGNYKKGHLKLQGLDIALENPKGSTRSGTDKDGKAWQSTMAHDYGYIKRTLGADGDHVDVFIGDRPDSETVYVVDQVDPKTGKFDEHKVMMGFADEQAAQAGYLANYEKGWKGLGSIKAMPVEEFRRWVKDGDTTKPVGEQPAAGVDIGTLTDDEVLAVADELGISHDDNPDDARWGLEGAKKDALSTAIARVSNPSSTTPIKPAASNSNIVSAPPLQGKGGDAKRAVSFSKQAMAQGEKPAKHLTRKEAELVTKEWFKQYRGASGIDVQIHATQAELEKALGLAAKDGLIRRAAFDDDNGTLHVAADTIAHPKRMREILRHEVLAHYGLANVLGDGEYTKLISRIIKSKSAPSMKAVWDWVDTHYAGEDVGVQAEEVIAHLAELEQSAWRRGWDQVVAWVTKALRTVGFVPGGITAAETRVLIEGLGKKMKRGGPDNGGPDGGHKFSQESEQPTRMSQEIGAGADKGSLRDVIKSIRGSGVTILATEKGGVINIAKIAVNESERGNGKGTSAMREIMRYADRTSQMIALSPSADFGGNKSRLETFYKGLGFIENKGKNKDFSISESMYRPANEKPSVRFSQANTAADKAMEKLNLGPKPDIIDKTKANLDKLRKVDRGVVESWVDRFIKKANTEVLDALAPIKYAEDAAGITDAADSGYVAARMATGAASTMQATMLYGLPEWKDGVIQRKAGTGEKDALLGIFSDLGADLHNWLGWMAGHRAELLMAQGRENLLDANDIAALKGQGKGKEAKFLDAKARWNRLNAATLDLAQEAGLFTKEARAEFENEWYIPFFRESDDGDVIAPFKPNGIANQNAGIKKLKGGEANTNDLLENIFTSTSKLIDASMKNMAAQKTVWNLADTGLIEVIPKPNKMDYQALANGKDRIMLKLEGEEYMLRVEDPDLYRAMTFFDRQPFGTMINMASKAKRLLTAGVTASPEFMLRNFLRDSLSSWAISKDGFKPVIDSIKGVKKTLAMDGSTIDVMFSGASFLGGYVNGNDPTAMADTVRKSLRRKGMTPEQIARYEKSIIRNAAQAKGVVANVWEKYNRYGEAFENANREAVYAAAIKAGKSHAQAAFESKDLMDFSMMGAARFIQGASMVLPFFNARLQGLGKLSRELRDNPREIAKRAGMITAMSLGLLAANWDDERYEELPDWDKDANWHFFVGDQHFRIPKPFEIGVMFGTIPERMVRAMGDKDTGAQFGKAVARAIGDTFALNPTPQIIKPLVEAAFNYDTFRGGPIDSPQDLAVKAEARYNEQTSLLMRELGELSGFSPKQLEHLVIGYTGTIGGYVMATADGLIRASRPGESASWRADEIPLVKAVYRGTGPAKSTQHMEEFYRMLSEVNQLKRTVDQYRSEGLDDKANELLDEQGGILKSRRSLSRTQQQVRVVRNKIELIQRDRTMNAEEKRKRIDELLARRNDLVYQAVNKNRENWE
ncbi:LPD38 domain-containing protein [Aeromonas veronii]|uniref:LPD38 domain-containing protein n=1 Tax=Aeromonas veronii TaxID=654 RepID=UPI003D1CA9AB